MPNFKCYPISDPNAQWEYCPSYAAAIAFSALFGIVTVGHTIQAILYRKPFALVLIMGAAWETAGYIFRTLSVEHQLNETYSTAQDLLILLAPLWINAFAYMVLGRMIHFYLPADRVFGIRARRITLMFVLFDIFSFLVQATGGLMTTPAASPSTQKTGIHVYMGGVGLQLFFITIFLTLAIQFHRLVRVVDLNNQSMDPTNESTLPKFSRRQAVRLVLVLYAALTLIVYRNIYRLIEFSAGVESSITEHEFYTWIFDSIPMFLAILVFNIFHPGQVLRGANCDFSEQNRQIKEEKKARKAAKKEERQEKKAEKKERAEIKKKEKQMSKGDKFDNVDLSV